MEKIEQELLSHWTVRRIEKLKNQFLSNDVKINKAMFKIIKKRGDFKEKEKTAFDKKFILKNGEVWRKSDNSMLVSFNLSSIIYQRDLVYYYCIFEDKESEISKNVWEVLNYWNEKK